MSLEVANREVYRLLEDGIPVSIPDRERGGQKTERLLSGQIDVEVLDHV
ncbi:MAG: hypothetical protein JXA15_11560 [Spirochaetales bacterium]|nr:hypothetical protein [Spirochaetales bacterium]